jgi:hypothetical protein
MRTERRAPRVIDVCYARHGTLKGARVAAFISQWAIASRARGGPITSDQYAEYWCESERNVRRHLARFRETFPELHTPQPIADGANARTDEWLARGWRGLGELPVSGLVPA